MSILHRIEKIPEYKNEYFLSDFTYYTDNDFDVDFILNYVIILYKTNEKKDVNLLSIVKKLFNILIEKRKNLKHTEICMRENYNCLKDQVDGVPIRFTLMERGLLVHLKNSLSPLVSREEIFNQFYE